MKIKKTVKMLVCIGTVLVVFFTAVLNSAADFEYYSDAVIEENVTLSDDVEDEAVASENQQDAVPEDEVKVLEVFEDSELENKPSIIYRETFENFNINNPPKSWSVTQAAGLKFSIGSDSNETNKFLAMERIYGESGGGSAVVTFPSQSGVVSVSFKFCHNASPNNKGNSRPFMELRSDGQRFERITFYDGSKLTINDRGIDLVSYKTGQWYSVKVIINLEKGTSDVYVDGQLVKSGISFWTTNNNKTFSDINLSCWTDRGEGFLYLDDLVIENEAYNMVRDDMKDLTFTTENFHKYDFEDDIAGEQPENWNISYYQNEPSGTYAKVAQSVTGIGDNHTKMLEIYRPDVKDSAAVIATKIFEPLDGTIEIGFRYYRNSNLNTIFSLSNDVGEFERLTFKYDSDLKEYIMLLNDSNNNDIKIQFINPKEWFDIKLFLDMNNEMLDVYVNGMLKADDIGIWKKDILRQSKVLSKITITYDESSGSGSDYFDDIYMGKLVKAEEWNGSYELTGDIFLPSIGFKGSEIIWKSNKPEFIDNMGNVVRPLYIQGDQAVTLTALLDLGGNRVTKEFYVTVLKNETLTDAEKVFLDKEALTLEKTTGVIDDIYLPSKGEIYGSTITWSSSNPSVISENGTVNRPVAGKGDVVVTLTAILQLGDAVDAKYFNIEVLESTKSSARNGGGGRSVNVSRVSEVPVTTPEPYVSQNNISNNIKFTDLNDVDWAKESIEKLAEMGIVKGLGNSIFGPNENVTREQFIQMLMNAFNLTDHDAEADFIDVDKDAWYYRSVATAKKLNIINGYPDGSFGVGKAITREEMAVMVYRTAQLKGIHFEAKVELVQFNDEHKISNYAKGAVQAMQQAGIIQGISENEFAPHLNATRAQAAKIIFQVIQMAQ